MVRENVQRLICLVSVVCTFTNLKSYWNIKVCEITHCCILKENIWYELECFIISSININEGNEKSIHTHTSQTDVLDRDITPIIKDVNAFKKNLNAWEVKPLMRAKQPSWIPPPLNKTGKVLQRSLQPFRLLNWMT